MELKENDVKFVGLNELKKIKEFDELSRRTKDSLGDLLIQYELTKSNIINNFLEKQSKYKELEEEIKQQFGEKIKVDINTGEVTIEQ